MNYVFKVGRKNLIRLKATDTFEKLCFSILSLYKIDPDHIFYLQFENGDESDSGTPLGPIDGTGNFSLKTKLKNREMHPGEIILFTYDPSTEWSRQEKLVEISQ